MFDKRPGWRCLHSFQVPVNDFLRVLIRPKHELHPLLVSHGVIGSRQCFFLFEGVFLVLSFLLTVFDALAEVITALLRSIEQVHDAFLQRLPQAGLSLVLHRLGNNPQILQIVQDLFLFVVGGRFAFLALFPVGTRAIEFVSLVAALEHLELVLVENVLGESSPGYG